MEMESKEYSVSVSDLRLGLMASRGDGAFFTFLWILIDSL